MYYVVSLGVVAIGVTFIAIPAYRIFCEQTSFGGLTQVCIMCSYHRVDIDCKRLRKNSEYEKGRRSSYSSPV